MRRKSAPTGRRRRLFVEFLEDRCNPSGLIDPFAATYTVVGSSAEKINVITAVQQEDAATESRLAAPFAADVQHAGFGVYTVTLATGTDAAAAVTYYSGVAGVTAAEPDYTIQVNRTPNDPQYGSLYGMSKISAPTAWDTTTGTGNFVVAVIDSGVDYTHPDLAANMWRNPAEVNGDGLDNDGNGLVDDFYGANFAGTNTGNPMDTNGHGTHVAGTIGAVGSNGVGVAGVNWNVKVMALRFLDANGSGSTSDAIEALNYAVAHGVKVSNNSWGGGGYSTALFNAIQAAQAKGHVFVAAAGNSGVSLDATPSYPASYSLANVVAVAATTSTDAKASYSNFSPIVVDIAAPGSGIVSTTPNNTYSNYSGTSMASPHVAGAIALYWDSNPTATATQVIDRLKASADTVAGLTSSVQGGKRLNVGALIGVTSPPPPPADATGARVTAAAFNGTTVLTGARVTFNEAINLVSFTAADVTFTGPTGAVTINGIAAVAGTNNTQFDLTFATLSVGGTYTLVLGPNVLDAAGNAMDQNANGVNGEATADRYTATRALAVTTTQTFTGGGLPLAIRDLTYTRATLTINQDVTVSDLNARFSLTHTYDSDLVIRLVGPGGQAATLANRRGGSGDNFTNTTLDDEAAGSITSAAAPFAGSYRPETALTTFDGRNARGTWTLEIYDTARADTGTLTAFSLIVTGTNGVQTATTFGVRDAAAFTESAAVALAFANPAAPERSAAEPVTAPPPVALPVALPTSGPVSTPSLAGLCFAESRMPNWIDPLIATEF